MIKKNKKKVLQSVRLIKLKFKHLTRFGSLKYNYKDENKIIFCVNGWGHHGGWTDRLKGIISTYHFAKKHNFQYKLWYDFPCELNEVLPFNPNLSSSDSDKRYNPLKDRIHYLIDKNNALIVKKLTRKGKNFIYYNIDELNSQSEWRATYKEIFKDNKIVENKVNELLKSNPQNIAFVFRFLNHLGDFKLDRRKGLSKLKKEKIINNYLVKVSKYLGKIEQEEKLNIYAFSDSDIFLTRVTHQFPQIININPLKRNFIHYKNQPKNKAKDTLERTLFDFMFLASCDEIHHFVDHKYLYSSGFPKYASILNNSTYKVTDLESLK
ncbi:hypothetical protein LB452_10900 [Psychroflexus sp. CAK8W]|uniref:Uncharacterized protein n=1 Tax=Psychroflexus longus TaxID=2873596 RepID=A0ABS7XKB4_9FLAO|nr:hypothetical protein [Psychroflexus longus]MBZ9779429.1 hypothetical protein [Psychroflexus longus]